MVEEGGTILIFEIQKNLEEKKIIKILFFFFLFLQNAMVEVFGISFYVPSFLKIPKFIIFLLRC